MKRLKLRQGQTIYAPMPDITCEDNTGHVVAYFVDSDNAPKPSSSSYSVFTRAPRWYLQMLVDANHNEGWSVSYSRRKAERWLKLRGYTIQR